MSMADEMSQMTTESLKGEPSPRSAADEETQREGDELSKAAELAVPKPRVKKIMKADEDVKAIKPEALTLVTRSSELFVGQFIEDSYHFTKEDKRKTVKLKDMEKAIQAIEVYDFLTTDEHILSKESLEPDAKRAKTEPGDSGHDFWLPMSSVRRVAKAKLNAISDGRVNLEASAAVGLARAATIFVSMLTACALEGTGKRTTLMAEDIYKALEDAEFQFAGELATFLAAEEKHDKHKAAQPKTAKKISGFFKFSMVHRDKVRADNPEAGVSGCAKILGTMWRALSDEERLAFKDEGPVEGAASPELAALDEADMQQAADGDDGAGGDAGYLRESGEGADDD